MKTVRLLITLLCLITVSSCGFHLRGYKPITQNLQSIYLQTNNPYGYLALQLKQILHSTGVTLLPSPDDRNLTLRIFDESFRSTKLSDSASSTTKKYILHYRVSYQLLDATNKSIYGPKTIKSARTFLVNEDQVLSSSNEEALLLRDLQRDSIYQIMHQLSSSEVKDAITKAESHETTS